MSNAPAAEQRRPRRTMPLGPDLPTVFAASLLFIVVTFAFTSPSIQWMRHWLSG